MTIKDFYTWTDDPTESGIALCDTDILNDCLMHLKYQNGAFPLLYSFWSDHEIDDMAYLRADTFSWQSGATYTGAYNELETQYTDVDSTTETVDGITYKVTPKGYKIALPDQEQAILNKYTITGQAWYYILDVENVRFKLPRTKYGFTGLRTTVGSDVKAGLPAMTESGAHTHTRGTMELTGSTTNFLQTNGTRTGVFSNTQNGTTTGNSTGKGPNSWTPLNFNASLGWSGETSSNGTHTHGFNGIETTNTVQPPATQMYLYFYVGNFTQSAVENTAGLNAELFNNKADNNLANLNAEGEAHFDSRYLKPSQKETITSWAFPSGKSDNLTPALNTAYDAPAAGIFAITAKSTAPSGWVILTNLSVDFGTSRCDISQENGVLLNIEAGTGQQVAIFGSWITVESVKFIYANGGADND